MSHRALLALAALAVAGLLLLPACRRPTDLSGESMGQYEVRGQLEENTCESGYAAPESLWFHVELRDAAGSELGWWKLPDAGIVEGTMTDDGTFRFEGHQPVVAVEADPALGVPGCTLDRAEVVSGTLRGGPADASVPDDAGAGAAPGFTGTTTVVVSAASGDCSSLVGSTPGQFPTLPCELRYALEAERVVD
ncbi:MAG TPA: hypothetical protein RMH99_22910 [Sandaracinaceae bacterium LLY-WYZ-13_1]|nr:hypothetical protein [Sandaracinaceae bacterium LLY-WYZ-13_1]